MIRISWRSKITGYESHGKWFDKSKRIELEEKIKWANVEFPSIRHWIEEKE